MRLLGLLLAMLAVAQPVRAEADWLVCRMSGAAMRACCCPEKTAPRESVITRDGCCDTVHVESAAPASLHVVAAPTCVAPLVAVVGFVATAPTRSIDRVHTVAIGAHPRVATGPPRVPVYLNVRHVLG